LIKLKISIRDIELDQDDIAEFNYDCAGFKKLKILKFRCKNISKKPSSSNFLNLFENYLYKGNMD